MVDRFSLLGLCLVYQANGRSVNCYRLSLAGEAAVDADQGLFLLGRKPWVQLDRRFDGVGRLVADVAVEQAGLGIERLGRKVQRPRDLLENLGRRLVEP